MEKKAEMLSNNEQSVAENKARRADEKAERKAEKLAAKSVLPPVVLHSDFTESFDQVAYDAEKQAIEDAKVQAKAEARAAKLEKRAASEAKAEARVADSYDKAAGEQIAKMEKKAEMLSNNEQSVAENKARKAAEKAERKAEKLAAKSVLPPVVLHSDFTESFDQAAYDAEKQAIEDAKAQAKAEARAAKLEKRAASEAKEEARVADSYDKATGEQIVKMERKAEYASFLDQADADKKQVKAQEKAKAEQLRAKAKNTPDPDKDYNDPEFISDEFDMQEHYENSSAKLKDATEKNTNKLYGREEIKIAARNSKDSKAVDMLESKFGNSEMLDYAKGYDKDIKRNRKQLERAEKYGKFMLEYGSTYDPEWDGEFNNYGLPAADPFTDGVKLSSSRRRTPKREKLSHFDAEKLSSLARMQCETDNNMIVARLESQHRDLELEVAKAEQDFSGEFRNNKEKRLARENRKKLKNFKTKIGLAQKYEKLDNERYYSVVSTNFERVQLPERADRDDLIAMREELMRLLDIRDEINAQLIQLYTGDEKGNGVNHLKRRNKVVLKARKRAHARYRKYANALHKYRVTRNEKMRIFDRMDEIVELKGELARIKYILRKEKPIARARREYVREKGNAKSNIRYARRYVDRFTKKAIRRAKRRQRRNRAMILSLTALALIAVLGVTVYLIGPQLLGALKTVVPADYHKYIDNILSNWPF